MWLNLQHDGWETIHFELSSQGRKPGAVNLANSYVGIGQGLSHMSPNWFETFTMGTPRSIELETKSMIYWNIVHKIQRHTLLILYSTNHYQPLSISTYVKEPGDKIM